MTNGEAIKTIETAIAEVEWEYPMEYAAAFETAIEALKNDAVPVVHGNWIYNKRTDSFGCSNCSMSMVRNVYSYCPWCGSKMDEVSE